MMFEYIDALASDVILEMGCGDGSITVDYAIRMKSKGRLICNDIAENMCKITAERMRRLGECIIDGNMVGYREEIFKPIDTSVIKIEGRRVVIESPNVEVLHADNENL